MKSLELKAALDLIYEAANRDTDDKTARHEVQGILRIAERRGLISAEVKKSA